MKHKLFSRAKNLKKRISDKISKEFSKRFSPISKKISAFSDKISKKFPRSWRVFRAVFNLKNLVLILKPVAVFLAGFWAVNYIFGRQFEPEEVKNFILNNPEITGYSTLILTILAFILWPIIGSATWTIGIYYIFAIIIMFVNEEKMRSRNTPFMFEDLAMSSEAGSLLEMVNWENLWRTVFQVLAIILACFLVRKFTKKLPRYNFDFRLKLAFRLILLSTTLSMLARHTEFLRTELSKKGTTTVEVDWLGENATIDFTNPSYNFSSNGFVVGTISTFQARDISKPENYSKETIDKIIKKYSNIAKKENARKKSLRDEKINIVYIMSESFIDPNSIRDIYDFAGDPMPFTRELIQKHSSGQTTVAEYGGGTANIEFEALTGLSKKFYGGIPYTSILSKEKSAPSIAKFLKENNYKTTAIHPYRGTMYRRNAVYPNLGIDNFIDQSKMKNSAKIDKSQYISDASAFDEVFETMKNSPESDFVHLVTMQNHMPYVGDIYDRLDFQTSNKTDPSDNYTKEWTNYLQGVKHSDDALKNFLEKINSPEEKTIVAFWGDHWPGIAGKIDSESIKHTPLLIYANFETEKQDLQQMSLNYLPDKVLDVAGAKKSPFQYLLAEVQKTNPKLTAKEVTDNNLTLQEYELIQYDLLAGSKFSLGDFYKAP